MPARSKRSLASSQNIRRKFLKAGPMSISEHLSESEAKPAMETAAENFGDIDSDVEVEQYAFDSEMMQTLNILAMLRYDKEGEKKLKGPAKRTGSSRTSNWRRYAPKKQERIAGVKPLTTYFSSTSSITNNGKRSADNESNDTSLKQFN
ncbi:hypothetical protein V1505DRAFT_378100 [Lipomyces doorenjongii]